MEQQPDHYASKLARARKRHAKPFKSAQPVARMTPPSMILNHLNRLSPKKKAAPADAPAVRRIGSGA